MKLLLKNCKLINGEDVDLLIENEIVQKIDKEFHLNEADDIKVYDVGGSYVSKGWVDSHTHSSPLFLPYGDEADKCGYPTGVTTVIDAGSTGADAIGEFYNISKNSKTRVKAFLNISKIGLSKMDELSNIENVDFSLIEEKLRLYPEFIVGLKVRMSKSIVKDNGIDPLKLTLEYNKNKNLKVMVHIGNGPPKIEDILELLDKNCILSHYLNGKENSIIRESRVLKEFESSLKKGVIIDVAHGNASFSFNTGRIVKKSGIPLNLISTDIYKANRENGPVYSLAHVMTKFLYLGYSLKDIIDAVTVNPMKTFNLKENSDLTIFDIEDKEITLVDSHGEKVKYNKVITPKSVVLKGEFIQI